MEDTRLNDTVDEIAAEEQHNQKVLDTALAKMGDLLPQVEGTTDLAPRIAALKKEADELTITGLDDKDGYKAVHDMRMKLVRTRTAIDKVKLALTKPARDFVKKVNAYADEILNKTEPIEKSLKAKQDAIDGEKERLRKQEEERQRQRTQARVHDLLKHKMEFDGTTYRLGLLSIDTAQVELASEADFNAFLNDVRALVDKKAAEQALINRTAARKALIVGWGLRNSDEQPGRWVYPRSFEGLDTPTIVAEQLQLDEPAWQQISKYVHTLVLAIDDAIEKKDKELAAREQKVKDDEAAIATQKRLAQVALHLARLPLLLDEPYTTMKDLVLYCGPLTMNVEDGMVLGALSEEAWGDVLAAWRKQNVTEDRMQGLIDKFKLEPDGLVWRLPGTNVTVNKADVHAKSSDEMVQLENDLADAANAASKAVASARPAPSIPLPDEDSAQYLSHHIASLEEERDNMTEARDRCASAIGKQGLTLAIEHVNNAIRVLKGAYGDIC